MKYRFIEEHREAHKIKRMCEVLKVSYKSLPSMSVKD
jgi:hypothetical protein